MEADEVLALGSRRGIYDFVRSRPGAHLREVARSLDLPLGTALYHLACLERASLLVVRRDGRYKRFFARDALGRFEKDYVSMLHHAVPRAVVATLLARGPLTQRELCTAAGVSRSTLSFHVNNLVARGMVDREAMWPENAYRIRDPDVAREMLTVYGGDTGVPS